MRFYYRIPIIFFVLMSLFRANLVQAGIVPCTDNCNLCHLWQMGSRIINFLTFDLAIPVAALLFIAAGVMFIISGGDETKVTRAKSIFTNTVIGLLIIFCSWLIIDGLFKTIVNEELTGPWNSFPACQ